MNIIFVYNAKYEWKEADFMRMKWLDLTALLISVIGCVNWGLIGLFSFDLVAFIFGDMSLLARIVYVVVGLCGLYLLTFLGRICNDTEA